MKSEKLFSNKVQWYVKYRPPYSPEMVEYLCKTRLITPTLTVADVGAGSGGLTRQIIDHVGILYAVEPNKEMLEAATKEFCSNSKFIGIRASAEATTLLDASIDVVAVGQAFHWFNPSLFCTECHRILRQGGKAFMVWNRKTPGELETERRAIVDHYDSQVDSFGYSWDKRIEGISSFFRGNYEYREFDFPIVDNWESFIGRTLSSSHALEPDSLSFKKYLADWADFFSRHSDSQGKLVTPNKTVLFYGEL